MQEHRHRRIDTKTSEFRLSHIEKSNDATSPIDITLRHAQLDEEAGQFNALSYAWSEESPTYEVYIHDGVTKDAFRVRQNLYDFLCTVRKMTKLTEWIWIDQICIDQTQNDEKCHQVSQMGQLYSTAKSTEETQEIKARLKNKSIDGLSLKAEIPAVAEAIDPGQEAKAVGWREVFAGGEQQNLRRVILDTRTSFMQLFGSINVVVYYLPVILTQRFAFS
ncbi:hypothetical protein E8E12_001283 [Didymella heteroderae]|uniref:Heterokaryon incompatibility domain-containing protein n=1 Tax=Didymella heteroderae TaxID=1769908 RepID=A0A9P5BY41_9PLEO|nr:hypothetical protein E8E12_001283 [Didymella heteroderae]